MRQGQYDNLLHDPACAGVYRTQQAGMADLLAAAEASGLATHRIDLSKVRDRTTLFECLATTLKFPDWFGHNWDALADCLSDLSWLPAKGHVILLEHCDSFRDSHAEDFASALQVFADAAEVWRNDNVPFWILVDTSSADIPYLQALT
jgi:RNAse (barnase) inhibitor barstar